MKAERREKRSYDEDFKLMVVKLIHNGAKKKDVIREYDLISSAPDKLVK